jgi:hypothetical protein
MEETLPVKEKLYDSSNISNICGVELSESQRNALEFGERVFLSNMKREDGSVIDGEVFLKPGKDNQPEMHFNFKREELVIPDKLLGKTLTEEEKTTLENGRMVGPIKHKEGEFYLQADLKLNQIVIKSDKELGIKNEIGGYKFTDSEKLMLAEGGKLGARVYKGEQGYFVAEMQMTPDKRGITVSNIKSISNNEAKELIQKLNFPEQEKPKNVLEGAANTFTDGVQEKSKEQANVIEGVVNTVTKDTLESKNVEHKSETKSQDNKELDGFKTRDLTEAIDNKDFKKLADIAKEGIKPSNEDIAKLNSNEKLSYEEKVAIATVLKLDPKETIKEIKMDIESNIKSAQNSKNINITQRQENKIKM